MSDSSHITEKESNYSIFRMSDEKTMELIKLYKKEECLYNTDSEHYNIRQRRKEAAERIAKEINIPNFQARHVMLKFKNLRNSYCQVLKKIAQSKNNGEDMSAYKPRAMWFSTMDFIKPYLPASAIGKRQPTLVINGGVIKREPEPEPEDPDDLWELSEDVDLQEEQMDLMNPEDGSDNVEFFEYDQSKKRGASQISLPGASPKRTRTEELIDQGIKDISSQISMLNDSIRPRQQVEGTPDLYDHFGTYVASLLRNISASRAVELQPKIVDMIAKAYIDEK